LPDALAACLLHRQRRPRARRNQRTFEFGDGVEDASGKNRRRVIGFGAFAAGADESGTRAVITS
jgi:hypothetical protein